jgi:hypothetical protein
LKKDFVPIESRILGKRDLVYNWIALSPTPVNRGPSLSHPL